MSCETILPGLGYDLLACGKYKSNCRVILVKGTHSLIWCNQTGSTTTSVTTDTQAPALEAHAVGAAADCQWSFQYRASPGLQEKKEPAPMMAPTSESHAAGAAAAAQQWSRQNHAPQALQKKNVPAVTMALHRIRMSRHRWINA